ncbi:hypothetical protein [Streptomyces omiyaensis]|uniref:Uncharacterized protein n=1 Tax=Streptomyces omiyaensis TaxID=68247 RepID=A0ABW7C481_9ACTN|nr:hypothetical protein [Streptomyces omiyaensis]
MYLNDHLAGAAGGAALARRVSRSHRSRPSGPRLAELATEIAEDRESLREVMRALDVPVRRTKTLIFRLAEKTARIKPNGRLLRRSPLSDLLELEALRLSVEGKLAWWRTLHSVARTDDRVDQDVMRHLVGRAEQQIRVLEGLCHGAATTAFASDGTGGRHQLRAAAHRPKGWGVRFRAHSSLAPSRCAGGYGGRGPV